MAGKVAIAMPKPDFSATPQDVRFRFVAAALVCLTVLLAAVSVGAQKPEDDPNLIGRRTVARKNVLSPDKEQAIGKSQAARYEAAAKLVPDPAVRLYVTGVAEQVVSHSDWKGPVSVKVVRAPRTNCISLPGGYIYLSAGMLLAAKSDDEVAALIAHQVAHAAARHWGAEVTRQVFKYIPLNWTLAFEGDGPDSWPNVRSITRGLACVGYIAIAAPNSPSIRDDVDELRRNELEADYLGLQYVYKAGYDPSAYIDLLTRLAPGMVPQGVGGYTAVLPPVSKRITAAQSEISMILPNAPKPRATPEFVLVKSLL